MTFRWWLVYDGFPFWVIDMESTIAVPGQRPARPPSLRASRIATANHIARLLAAAR